MTSIHAHRPNARDPNLRWRHWRKKSQRLRPRRYHHFFVLRNQNSVPRPVILPLGPLCRRLDHHHACDCRSHAARYSLSAVHSTPRLEEAETHSPREARCAATVAVATTTLLASLTQMCASLREIHWSTRRGHLLVARLVAAERRASWVLAKHLSHIALSTNRTAAVRAPYPARRPDQAGHRVERPGNDAALS